MRGCFMLWQNFLKKRFSLFSKRSQCTKFIKGLIFCSLLVGAPPATATRDDPLTMGDLGWTFGGTMIGQGITASMEQLGMSEDAQGIANVVLAVTYQQISTACFASKNKPCGRMFKAMAIGAAVTSASIFVQRLFQEDTCEQSMGGCGGSGPGGNTEGVFPAIDGLEGKVVETAYGKVKITKDSINKAKEAYKSVLKSGGKAGGAGGGAAVSAALAKLSPSELAKVKETVKEVSKFVEKHNFSGKTVATLPPSGGSSETSSVQRGRSLSSKKKRKKRAPAFLAGLSKKLGDSKIGISQDNVFQIVHRAYAKKARFLVVE